jgi:hypothetical protein
MSDYSFSSLLSPASLKLLSASGTALISQIGIDVVRDVVFDVLCGKNLRDSTETLTRRRITALNMALVQLFVKGAHSSDEFISLLPHLASEILQRPRLNTNERRLAQWMLGLTGKAVQNVLRDNPALVAQYRDDYIEACQEIIQNQAEYGNLVGAVDIQHGDSNFNAELDWQFLVYLMNAVGAQTLTIRGSEKSAYGKLFEKLILGSLLTILGFTYAPQREPVTDGVFWLSQRGNKRESDATLIYEMGKSARFDIGFIGRGNTEISLDKVSRFEKELELHEKRYYTATIIIVDRVGSKSRIVSLARDIGGSIIQMSGSYWPQQVAQELHNKLGFDHELVTINEARIEAHLKSQLDHVPMEEFIKTTTRKSRK